jgi:hypothetical protein
MALALKTRAGIPVTGSNPVVSSVSFGSKEAVFIGKARRLATAPHSKWASDELCGFKSLPFRYKSNCYA